MKGTLSAEYSGNRYPVKKPGFFVRQFAPLETQPQRVFDIAFGVVGPVLCFIADPIVFQGGIFGERPLFRAYQLFAYLVSAIEMAVLILWLTSRRHLGSFAAFFGGVLIAGSIFSTIVGLAILPYSLIGLMFLIGVLGFTPFLTAFVYLRNGVRAVRAQQGSDVRLPLAILSAVLSITLPWLVSLQLTQAISRSIADVLYGDANQAEAAVNRLRWVPFVPDQCLDPIVEAYVIESSLERKDSLKKYYRYLSGEDIETRADVWND